MNILVCVNCHNNKHVNDTSNRLVTESCGHVKCMECLLKETAGCQACARETKSQNVVQISETEKERTADDKETQQTDLAMDVTDQAAEVVGEAVETNDIVVTKEIVVLETKCSAVDVPKETEKSEEQDWNTKKMFKPDLPHIRMNKDGSGATTYYCLKCKKEFRARSHVNYHSYCNGAKKPYQCAECNKEFATSTHYQYHLRAHRDERPFACDVCGATFRYMSKLQRHKLLHSGEKRHTCKQCSKSFATPTALRRHGLLHSGEQPHQCSVCNRRFRDHSNYKKHVQRHGEDELKCLCGPRAVAAGPGRAHRCPRCQLPFRCGKDLRRHMHVHTDSKPFRCRECDRRFRRKDNLERHIRNKHPEHTFASAADCDLEALRERAIVTTAQTKTTKVPKEASDKTQLEKLNPLPPIPKDVIQSMCDGSKRTTDKTEPVIDKSYILEANNARQSVIVAKFTAETDKQFRDSSPETAYVHKIKKSMATNAKDTMLPPIDTKKLFQFYKEARKTENLDIGDPSPENVQKLKTILMMDEKHSSGDQSSRGGDQQAAASATMHWRRKMTLNINWNHLVYVSQRQMYYYATQCIANNVNESYGPAADDPKRRVRSRYRCMD